VIQNNSTYITLLRVLVQQLTQNYCDIIYYVHIHINFNTLMHKLN